MADMTLEAYLNQFQEETKELLVRISWVPGAVHPESGCTSPGTQEIRTSSCLVSS